ncbi:LOW QUALITY PROTEIN: putative ABC transporter ATP-binding protein [Geomicrobium sp. JCM 19037]|nr:LOW QUALITY PROTEIN: putative ABC transporter ATP-binding protein [Geomicrobium sp. JCM 19037]
MINVHDVSFSYGKEMILNNVHYVETEPAIVGLWGRNGSGKTTLMKLLAGLLQPHSGSLHVNKQIPYNNNKAMNDVAFLQESHPYSDIWTVNDAMHFASLFNDNWDQQLADQLLERFELPRKKKVRSFSTGMKSMLTIVIGLSSKSPVTIMDEPTNGLDAIEKYFLDMLIETHAEHPRQIMLSTHHIDEILPLCEKIVVLHDQTIIRNEQVEDLDQKGVYVTGNANDIESFSSRAPVIERKSLGKQQQVMLDAPLSEQLQQEAKETGLRIEKAALQDYLVNLTTKGVTKS